MPSAGIISWIYASSVRLIKLAPQVRSALLLGVYVTMLFISTASAVGSKPAKCAPSTIASGSFRSMVTRRYSERQWWKELCDCNTYPRELKNSKICIVLEA